MKGFARRRFVNVTFAILAALLVVVSSTVYVTAINQNGFLTGWILFGLVLALSGYRIRKKVSTLPIGRASSWLQAHIYGGLIALFAFFVHVGWRIPDGVFEGMFAAVFLLVALSGVVGIAINRIFARRLTRRGEEVIFERIPGLGLWCACVSRLKKYFWRVPVRQVPLYFGSSISPVCHRFLPDPGTDSAIWFRQTGRSTNSKMKWIALSVI